MRQFFKLIFPQKIEIILSLALAVLFSSILNAKRFWFVIEGDTALAAAEKSSLDSYLSGILNHIDRYVNPNWLDLVMWLLIGCLGFLTFTTITAAIKSAEDEVEIIHYFHNPNGRRHEVIAYLSKFVVRVCGLLGGIIYLVTFFDIIMPFCSKLFFTSVTTLPDAVSWLWLGFSIIAFGASLYGFAIFARLVALKVRIL